MTDPRQTKPTLPPADAATLAENAVNYAQTPREMEEQADYYRQRQAQSRADRKAA